MCCCFTTSSICWRRIFLHLVEIWVIWFVIDHNGGLWWHFASATFRAQKLELTALETDLTSKRRALGIDDYDCTFSPEIPPTSLLHHSFSVASYPLADGSFLIG